MKHTRRMAIRMELFLLSMAVGTAIGFLLPARPASGEEDPLTVDAVWGNEYQTLSFDFLGQKCEYPRDVTKGDFPPVGQAPVFGFTKEWPVLTMRARWSISTDGWPLKYRPEAVDLILMYACDAQLYENIYPDVIRSSRYTFPPEYLKEAADPSYSLAEALRGKQVGYEIEAKAGFGAKDYKIKTRIRIGLSEDGKTVFYFDRPDYISAHLKTREYLFAAHDAGDRVYFEVKLLCGCTPRSLLRGEALRRVEADSTYFVRRIHENLDNAPTTEEIEGYLNRVRQQHQPSTTLVK